MPSLSRDRDPSGTVVKNMEIECHENVNERRDTAFRDPRTVAGRQEDLFLNQSAAACPEDARRRELAVSVRDAG